MTERFEPGKLYTARAGADPADPSQWEEFGTVDEAASLLDEALGLQPGTGMLSDVVDPGTLRVPKRWVTPLRGEDDR